MHSMSLSGGKIFIDALPVGKTAMTERAYKLNYQTKSGDPENGKISLIDPWRLLGDLKKFRLFFVEELHNSKVEGSELYGSFKSTFERNIVNPGKVYFSN